MKFYSLKIINFQVNHMNWPQLFLRLDRFQMLKKLFIRMKWCSLQSEKVHIFQKAVDPQIFL
jgi:hypothetical protein